MKNVYKLSPKQRNYSNLMYCTQGEGSGWGHPKPLKELQIIESKQCLCCMRRAVFSMDILYLYFAAGPCHTHLG